MNNLMKNEKEYTILGRTYRSSSMCAIGYTNPEKIRKQRLEHFKMPYKDKQFSKYVANIYGACNDNQVECILFIGELKPWIINIFNNISHTNSKAQQWDKTQKKMVYVDDGRTQKDIYYKAKDDKDLKWNKFLPDPELTKLDRMKENKIATQVAINEYTEEVYEGQRIPEERKAKMMKYIKYYDLEMPQSEPEWVNMYHQLAFYIRNKIDYAFDTNLYYICEECGALVRRGSEHICYCEIPEKRTKIDILVNGGV